MGWSKTVLQKCFEYSEFSLHLTRRKTCTGNAFSLYTACWRLESSYCVKEFAYTKHYKSAYYWFIFETAWGRLQGLFLCWILDHFAQCFWICFITFSWPWRRQIRSTRIWADWFERIQTVQIGASFKGRRSQRAKFCVYWPARIARRGAAAAARYAFQIKPKTWKYLGSTRVPLDGSEVPTLNLNPALLIEFSIFKSMA